MVSLIGVKPIRPSFTSLICLPVSPTTYIKASQPAIAASPCVDAYGMSKRLGYATFLRGVSANNRFAGVMWTNRGKITPEQRIIELVSQFKFRIERGVNEDVRFGFVVSSEGSDKLPM